jgi:2-amino-4-hydroxy-6-hydroxymethyldihydropteridine diphosphokinase
VTAARRRVVLALGSNLGDRLARLQSAVTTLHRTIDVVAVSPVFETDPVGGPQQPDYLNAVLLADTDLAADALLTVAHEVEAASGRERLERWGPRTLDVDIVAIGDQTMDTSDLVIPHPRAAERAFVLMPWLAVDPSATLPGRGPIAELLAGLETAGVRPRPDLVLHLPAGKSR